MEMGDATNESPLQGLEYWGRGPRALPWAGMASPLQGWGGGRELDLWESPIRRRQAHRCTWRLRCLIDDAGVIVSIEPHHYKMDENLASA